MIDSQTTILEAAIEVQRVQLTETAGVLVWRWQR